MTLDCIFNELELLLTNCMYIFCRNEPAYITMLVPFLRYLYCEPQRQPQHTLLRHSLLGVLLPACPGAGSVLHNKDEDKTSPVHDSLLNCLCQLVPHMQVTHWCQSSLRQQSMRGKHQQLPQILWFEVIVKKNYKIMLNISLHHVLQ